MLYLDRYDGYMADVPNVDFIRCDGEVFCYDEISTASMTHNHNTITITGGQGNFPLAYIDTDASLEFNFESAQFKLDMFEMANAAHVSEGDYGAFESGRFDVENGLKVTLPFEVQTESVHIRGMEEASAAAAGKYAVSITASGEQTAGSTVITFNDADVAVGDVVRVSYKRRVVGGAKVTVKTTSTSAKGEAWIHWPVMSDGSNCKEAAVKGWLHLHIIRVRVTAMPGFNSSYKQGATNGVTFAAIDPKRGNKRLYELIYEPTDEDGEIVNKSTAQSVEWD